MKCRICATYTRQFLDLGYVPLPEEFRDKKELGKKIHKFPLGLSVCTLCNHVQLNQQIDPTLIYKENYYYDYSITTTGLSHWMKLADIIQNKYIHTLSDMVIDIGCNTGLTLKLLQDKGTKVLGVDPATRLTDIARQNGISVVDEFFSEKVAECIKNKNGNAQVIISTNTLDHVENLYDFLTGVAGLLSHKGYFIIEVPYFPDMMTKLSHVVYHQQVNYFTMSNLRELLKRYGFEIISAEKIPIHGGSVRVIAGFSGQHTKKTAQSRFVKSEKEIYENFDIKLRKFTSSIKKQRDVFVKFVREEKRKGKTIGALGASAKGITFLNYCGLGKEEIDFIAEKSPLKQGLYTPSGIPVLSDLDIAGRNPDYLVILAWNFADEIRNNLKKIIPGNTQYVLPVPNIKIYK